MKAATKCMKGLDLTIPCLLDTMSDAYYKSYSGIPAGTTVIDINGNIAYWNPGAPNGCRPPSAEKTIKQLLKNGGGAKPAEWAPHKITRETTTDAPDKKNNQD